MYKRQRPSSVDGVLCRRCDVFRRSEIRFAHVKRDDINSRLPHIRYLCGQFHRGRRRNISCSSTQLHKRIFLPQVEFPFSLDSKKSFVNTKWQSKIEIFHITICILSTYKHITFHDTIAAWRCFMVRFYRNTSLPVRILRLLLGLMITALGTQIMRCV